MVLLLLLELLLLELLSSTADELPGEDRMLFEVTEEEEGLEDLG